MTSVYTDADYLAVYKQKQRVFGVFMGVTFAYLVFCLAWLLYYMSLPYSDSMQTLPKACIYAASVLYVVFAFPYLSIKYSRVRRYYKMMGFVSQGIKVEEKNYFYRFQEKKLQKENIDVVSCFFETWNKKKQEWMEREIYFDAEKPLPAFESGDLVRYVAQSNFIIQYEVLEHRAYEFSEEYDDEDEEYEEDETGESGEVDEENIKEGEKNQ